MPTRPQAQTRFVSREKRWRTRTKPIVVYQQDRSRERATHKVLDMVFDLFVELKASDEQLDFPIIYASAKNGYAVRELHDSSDGMTPLFEAIVRHVPPPRFRPEPFFSNAGARTCITAIIWEELHSGAS